jgi:hypothetical protein
MKHPVFITNSMHGKRPINLSLLGLVTVVVFGDEYVSLLLDNIIQPSIHFSLSNPNIILNRSSSLLGYEAVSTGK